MFFKSSGLHWEAIRAVKKAVRGRCKDLGGRSAITLTRLPWGAGGGSFISPHEMLLWEIPPRPFAPQGFGLPPGKLLKAMAGGREQRLHFHNLPSPFTGDVTRRRRGVRFGEKPMGQRGVSVPGAVGAVSPRQRVPPGAAVSPARAAPAAARGPAQPTEGPSECRSLPGNNPFPKGKIAPIQLIEWAPQK